MLPQHLAMARPMALTMATQCEAYGEGEDGTSRSSPRPAHQVDTGPIIPNSRVGANANAAATQEALLEAMHRRRIEELQRELREEGCSACMYTGMATCTGLSLYFAKLATDDTTLRKNRRFLWCCSGASLVAGAYRWYLGKEFGH